MHLPKMKFKLKLPLFFILLSCASLLIVNIVWFTSFRNETITITSGRVEATAASASDTISSFLRTKIISLIIHSQTEALLQQNIPALTSEMQTFLLQDQDIQELQVLDKNGKEIVHVTRNKTYPEKDLRDQSNNPAYTVTTFVGGNKYIGNVHVDEAGESTVDIAVPIVLPKEAQQLQKLSTSSVGSMRRSGEVLGVLIEKVHLDSLWESLSALKIDKTGYVYVVDDKGDLLTAPKGTSLTSVGNTRNIPEVNNFLTHLVNNTRVADPAEKTNDNAGHAILSAYNSVSLTNWGVIAQVSLSDTLAASNGVGEFAIILFLITIIISGMVSLFISSEIVKPLADLQRGSHLIGAGNFEYKLHIKTGDELEELGNTFNKMSLDLKKASEKQKQDRDIISAERNKMAVAISSIKDAVIGIDLQSRIVIFNKAAEKLTGFTAETIIGKPIDQILKIHDGKNEIPSSIYCPISNSTYEGTVFQKDNLTLAGNNTTAVVNVVSGQIKEGTQVNLGCIIALHDVSKEQELEKLKLDFVSIAAHELRTPITSIRGYLSVFMKENRGKLSDEQLMFLDRVGFATEQLTALIENILNVTRIEKGTFTLSKQSIDWVALVKKVIMELEMKAQEKKVEIVFIEPQQPFPYLSVDTLRITEVLSNLISNGINYTPSGGKITVSLEQKGVEIITHVQDNGKGISKEALPHLFTKFFRVKNKMEQGTKGTGLGLYISKSIVEIHGGKIWAESEEGKGSIFSFSLPIDNFQKNQFNRAS